MNLENSIRPILISGPCSAESEEQVFATAKALKENTNLTALRAGIWKPRTRPNSFEGVGKIGLNWIVKAGHELEIPVIIEVANSAHVEMALKAGIKNLWIGARSTVNPFTVQEIADSLKGEKDLTVLIKNPINPDLGLWIGAFERFQMAGINDLHAIHRGFSQHKKSVYRNEPMWEIPLALRTELPNIKMFCDPSHIAGRRDLLLGVSQKAMDLVYDGLMIETHVRPDEAWSDAAQQITPEKLNELLNLLVIRKVDAEEGLIVENLDGLRADINEIDSEILTLMAKRMKVIDKIGSFKKENNITILQPKRWEEINRIQLEHAAQLGLDANYVKHYLELIHQESIRRQTIVMNKYSHKTES